MENEERLKLFAAVSDGDPCLRVINERLQETLQSEFMVAINPQRTDAERLRACEGCRISYWNLHFIEDEREKAKAWKTEQEQKR